MEITDYINLAIISVTIFILAFYVIALIFKDASIIDVGWGLGISIIAIVLLQKSSIVTL